MLKGAFWHCPLGAEHPSVVILLGIFLMNVELVGRGEMYALWGCGLGKCIAGRGRLRQGNGSKWAGEGRKEEVWYNT